MWRMDIKTALNQAGSPANISTSFHNHGIKVSPAQVVMWKQRGSLPTSEWTGKTSYAPVICNLIAAMGYPLIAPIDLCPGAGQYMAQPDSDAACLTSGMDKQNAVETFGGVVILARVVGVAPQAVSKWPDPLPPRIADRVIAACVRQGIDPAQLLDSGETREAA